MSWMMVACDSGRGLHMTSRAGEPVIWNLHAQGGHALVLLGRLHLLGDQGWPGVARANFTSGNQASARA